MRKRQLFEIGKALFVVPFIIVFSLARIVLTEPRAQPIHTALWSNLFGQITAGNIQTIVFSVKSIGLIILFGLLYGRFISQYFEEISPYVFIRKSAKVGTEKNHFTVGYFYPFYVICACNRIVNCNYEN